MLFRSTLPQRFDAGELEQLSSLTASVGRERQPRSATAQAKRSRETQPRAPRLSAGTAGNGLATVQAAAAAARAVSERARAQHNQLARLRRRGFDVASVPFQFSDEVDLAGVRQIAEQLQRKL